MEPAGIFGKNKSILVYFAISYLLIGAAQAAITPTAPYQAAALTDPNPAVFTYGASIGYYNGSLIYAGSDGRIYAYSLGTGASTLVADTSALATAFSSVQGFLIASDGYLYFHDNATSSNIYRIRLADTWPAAYIAIDTQVSGSIYGFTENPWTGAIWFASADFFGGGNQFYLHEVNAGFRGVRLRAAFLQPNSGGNGPIIFKGPNTVLYGESVFGGSGYFHLVNAGTGEVIQENYLTIAGGLADAAFGYNNLIFATSGGGKKVLQVLGDSTTEIGITSDEARDIQFDEGTFYMSEMVPFGTGATDGAVRFNSLTNPSAVSEITAQGAFEGAALSAPSPAVFIYGSSVAYYNGRSIYAGTDGKVYGYSLDTRDSTVVSDTSALATGFSAVQGFLVASDGYLYFHDNAVTSKIYRVRLADAWPAAYAELDTGLTSSIYSFAENPWTKAVWFCSTDFFGSGNNFYLSQVNTGFTGVTQKAVFTKPNGGGNGPIIFTAPNTLLYGEAVFGGDGSFHQVNTTTGQVVQANYLGFTGGLADAVRGYENRIYATSGGGKRIFEIQGDQKTELAATNKEARGMVFDGASFLISQMVPFSGGADDGAISFLQLWQKRTSGVPESQQVAAGVDLNADGTPDVQQPDQILSVSVAGTSGAKQIGLSPDSADVVIEALAAVDPATIAETVGRPETLPFGLINFRATVASADGRAQIKVYLSEPAPEGALWYKYSTIDGWQDYSAYASLSADRKSVTLRLKDGDYGDADRIVNGEVLDPGGIGAPAAGGGGDGGNGGGGGGGGCFIDSAGRGCGIMDLAAMMTLTVAVLITAAMRSGRVPGKRP
jgi:hypothetical protein